jgi:putative addiction module component (TIGR02574 family)
VTGPRRISGTTVAKLWRHNRPFSSETVEDAVTWIASGLKWIAVTYADILKLPPSDRLELLEAIWDSLADSPESIPVSDELREELDLRLETYRKDPGSARPWDEMKNHLFRPR